MDYEEILDKHAFLNIIKSQQGADIEVSEEAVQKYFDCYEMYSDWTVHKFRRYRNQMSTRDAWLFKGNAETIDIVGDILTAKSVFEFSKYKGGEIE